MEINSGDIALMMLFVIAMVIQIAEIVYGVKKKMYAVLFFFTLLAMVSIFKEIIACA